MLVLSRKVGQEVVIHDGAVRVSVVSVKGRRVRLGVAAPREIPVKRQETASGTRCRQ